MKCNIILYYRNYYYKYMIMLNDVLRRRDAEMRAVGGFIEKRF